MHGQALAGEHALVDAGLAAGYQAVDRYALACAHHEYIADLHARDRHFDERAIALHARGLRLQADKRLDRGRGPQLCARFEQLAHQDQRDDHRARFEVDMLMVQAEQRHDGGQAVGRARAQRHQHVHVGAAAAQGLVSADVEAPADPELHRRGERELQPARQQFVCLAEHRQHLHQQRQTERDRNPEQPQLRVVGVVAARLFLSGVRLDALARVVPGLADRLDELFGRGQPGHIADARGLAGEIDRRLHAFEFVQRLFNARRAGDASHAVELELRHPNRHRVAGAADGLDHGGG